MKKICFVFTMLILMTSFVSAQSLPDSLTRLGDDAYETYEGGATVYLESEGVIYSFNKGTGYDEVHKYDIATDTWSVVSTSLSDWVKCDSYNNAIYCFSPSGDWYEWNTDTNSLDSIGSVSLGFSSYEYYCDSRPETDEIWCVYKDSGVASYVKADIGGVTISVQDTESTSDEAYTCKFRNNDELWCALGRNSGGGLVTKYVISTETLTEIDTDEDRIYASCRWYEDMFYCYGGLPSDWSSVITTTLIYVDPSDNSFGTIAFPDWASAEISTYDDSCVEIGNVDFCDIVYHTDADWLHDGYTLLVSWDGGGLPPTCEPDWSCNGYETCIEPMVEAECNMVEDNNLCGDIYGGDYSEFTAEICSYPPVITGYVPLHNATDVPAVTIDAIVEVGLQYVKFAGLIAIVGLGVWAMRL